MSPPPAQRIIHGPGHAADIAEPEASLTGPRTKVRAPALVDTRVFPVQPAGPARALDSTRGAWSGIGTGRLGVSGFADHMTEEGEVQAGREAITFDPHAILDQGVSAVCPLVIRYSTSDRALPSAATSTLTTGPLLSSRAAS